MKSELRLLWKAGGLHMAPRSNERNIDPPFPSVKKPGVRTGDFGTNAAKVAANFTTTHRVARDLPRNFVP